MYIQLIDFSIIIFFASASIVETEPYKFGNEYQFEQTILFYDGSKSYTGYQIKGEVKLELLNKDLYLIQLENPKLFYSKKCDNNYGFVPHKSNIDIYNNDHFIVELSEGKVTKIYISEEDDKGIINLKKAISNLFQFQISNYHGVESDLSGTCAVSYEVKKSDHIIKIKDNCILSNITAFKTTIWGGKLISKRRGDIFLENGKIISVTSWEEHLLTPHLSELIISNITSKVEMKLTGSEILKEKYPSEDIKSIVAKVEANKGKMFEIYDLVPQRIEDSCLNCPRFAKVISENAEYLGDKYLGSSKSASVYIEAVKAARRSSLHDIYNVINAKRNKKILPQLMDILGAAQTINTHQAAFKVLKINTEKYDLNLCERYFWALSMAPSIQPHILKELQELVKTKHQNNKLWQTIILTMATAVNKYGVTHEEHSDELVAQTVDLLKNKVKKCEGNEQCQELYIKALSNIHNEKSISVLLEIIDTAPKKSVARAMKGISKINPQLWNKDIVRVAEEVLQSCQTYDSSARIFALDILLRTKPSLVLLSRIVSILKQADKSRELKEYLLQRLVELSESNNTFKTLWKQIYNENGYNNYDALGQGGLSAAFARPFMPNGTLSTSQEIVGGILKQGSVNINLLHNGNIVNPFTLGIFAAGLSSFVATDEESTEDDEISTAGFELTVLGVDLRPFVFFNGTGELMSHVWSGTASSLTPAYQALLFLEDNTFSIFLGVGEEVAVRLESAASVDLSGEIEISLWNRNAHSSVKNRAGILLRNSMSINAPYIAANINADLSIEPELDLLADLDFSNGGTLCLQLHQPKTSVNVTSEKWVNIIGTNKMARRIRNIVVPVYGKSYALNSKNNYMCNKIFSS